jgi:hypothetical protein
VHTEIDQDWWMGHNLRTGQGAFPSRYVQEQANPYVSSCATSRLEDHSPMMEMERIIYDLRTFNPVDDTPENSFHPAQWPQPEQLRSPSTVVDAHDRALCISQTKTRLRTMLECQYRSALSNPAQDNIELTRSSFGATVGATVVFFMGAFVYALIDTLEDLGNEDTSLSLAFGMWWMIIPQFVTVLASSSNTNCFSIAILSGLLLAGNNPNTLEGVLALATLEKAHPSAKPFQNIWGLHPLEFALAYPSRFKISWLWWRGHNKQEWIDTVLEIYGHTNGTFPRDLPKQPPEIRSDPQMRKLGDETHLTTKFWWETIKNRLPVFIIVSILILVPFALAFVTSYTTPTIGLACRSFTFLIYLVTQVLQIILLMLAHTYHARVGKRWHILRKWVWFPCAAFFGAAAIFTAIGGTMIQLIGVYAECKCNVSMKYWLNLDSPKVWIEIGTNSALDILEAREYWRACGATAVTFLGVICYVSLDFTLIIRLHLTYICLDWLVVPETLKKILSIKL